MKTTVWILYEQQGQYSDYSMAVHGVFSSAEIAMAAFDKITREYYAANPWDYWEPSGWRLIDGVWVIYGYKDGTVAPFVVDIPRQWDARDRRPALDGIIQSVTQYAINQVALAKSNDH